LKAVHIMVLSTTIKQNLQYDKYSLLAMYYKCRRSQTAVPEDYPFYAAAVIGPFVYIGAVVHAALWRQLSSIMGSIVSLPVAKKPMHARYANIEALRYT